MDELNTILAEFDPITLKEMDGVKLLNRMDTKFMCDYATLLSVLQEVKNDYRSLEIKGQRYGKYETLYYDTKDLFFYRQHHRGKTNRYKFRKRTYIESDLNFMEIKFKNNRKRTIKNRTIIEEVSYHLDPNDVAYIESVSNIDVKLVPMLMNNFSRITLVNESLPERLTIDLGLSFGEGSEKMKLNKVVIVEAKQEKASRQSPFIKALKARRIRPSSFSKYCIGVALTFEGVKKNRFKPTLRKVNKIENEHHA